jgi:hypothetical protein
MPSGAKPLLVLESSKKSFALLTVSAFIALSMVKRFFACWYSNYLRVVRILALLHIVVSFIIIKVNPEISLLYSGASHHPVSRTDSSVDKFSRNGYNLLNN